MSDKELTPTEAYQALLDGKVIENSKIRLKTDSSHLLSSHDGRNWVYVSTHLLLNLTGYRLARKKVKKEVKFIPISALTGGNVLNPVSPETCSWWPAMISSGACSVIEGLYRLVRVSWYSGVAAVSQER